VSYEVNTLDWKASQSEVGYGRYRCLLAKIAHGLENDFFGGFEGILGIYELQHIKIYRF